MNKNTKLTTSIALAISLVGCGYVNMSAEDAIRYQSQQLVDTVNVLFASKGVAPDGDITKLIAAAGGALETTPDVYDEDAKANLYDRDAMLRLKVNDEDHSIKNEFGGEVKVSVKDGAITVTYTGVPSDIACDNIDNVICERP